MVIETREANTAREELIRQMEMADVRDFLEERRAKVRSDLFGLSESSALVVKYGFKKVSDSDDCHLGIVRYETQFQHRDLGWGIDIVIPEEPLRNALEELGFSLDKPIELSIGLTIANNEQKRKLLIAYFQLTQDELKFFIGPDKVEWPDGRPPSDEQLSDIKTGVELYEQAFELVNIIGKRKELDDAPYF